LILRDLSQGPGEAIAMMIGTAKRAVPAGGLGRWAVSAPSEWGLLLATRSLCIGSRKAAMVTRKLTAQPRAPQRSKQQIHNVEYRTRRGYFVDDLWIVGNALAPQSM
jgi:hypothetical protein